MPGAVSTKGIHYILNRGLSTSGKPLLVFIHGIGTWHYCFEQMAQHFHSEGFSTLQADNWGMGFSEYPSDKSEDAMFWGGQGHVDQLHDLLHELQLDNQAFFLVGHSMGGAIATLYADKHPSPHLLGICLLAPAGVMDCPLNLQLLRTFHGVSCFREYALGGLQKDKVNINNIKNFGDFRDKESADAMASHINIQRQHINNPNAILALFCCARFFPLCSLHATVDRVCRSGRRVLVLFGTDDRTVPPDVTLSYWERAAAPNVSTRRCPGAHLFFLESEVRDVVHGIMAKFLLGEGSSLSRL